MALKALRESANLTQLYVAKKLDVSVIAVSRWENGKNGIATKYLKRLGKLYGVPAWEIALASHEAQEAYQNKKKGENNNDKRIKNLQQPGIW